MTSAFSKSSVFVLSTHTRENSVFKKFHSGERFRKVSFSLIVFIGYVWSVKKKLRFQMKTDSCGQGLSQQKNKFARTLRFFVRFFFLNFLTKTSEHHKGRLLVVISFFVYFRRVSSVTETS